MTIYLPPIHTDVIGEFLKNSDCCSCFLLKFAGMLSSCFFKLEPKDKASVSFFQMVLNLAESWGILQNSASADLALHLLKNLIRILVLKYVYKICKNMRMHMCMLTNPSILVALPAVTGGALKSGH